MSIIAVLGATGTQGGSVIRQLQKDSSWKIRAITRNPEGKGAKELLTQGIEVVRGNLDDTKSLEAAFKGSTAIFAVTNFWDTPPSGPNGLEENGKIEHRQIINIGHAASKISSLQHLVISSLPSPEKVSDGRHRVPHMDYKNSAIRQIESDFPQLAPKITSLWIGWYASNMALSPLLKPLLWTPLGKYLWLVPSKPDGVLPVAGDVAHNTGLVVKRVLERPEQTRGKIIPLVVEYLSHKDALKVWEKVTGKEAVVVELTNEAAIGLIGPLGAEVVAQLRFSEDHPSWDGFEPEKMVPLVDITNKGELIGLEGTLKSYPVDTLL